MFNRERTRSTPPGCHRIVYVSERKSGRCALPRRRLRIYIEMKHFLLLFLTRQLRSRLYPLFRMYLRTAQHTRDIAML